MLELKVLKRNSVCHLKVYSLIKYFAGSSVSKVGSLHLIKVLFLQFPGTICMIEN